MKPVAPQSSCSYICQRKWTLSLFMNCFGEKTAHLAETESNENNIGSGYVNIHICYSSSIIKPLKPGFLLVFTFQPPFEGIFFL